MTNINILPPHLADMIAAGEVVDRPASVIKELVENALDAGAKNITVEIKNGGATFIRITDDGKGMSPDDAGVAFLRHATSKLRDERGLEAIGTMGFRGEALAAISAVSHIELVTREKTADCGTKVTLSAGEIQDMVECGCRPGTVMTVKDLFYNTPARLKFLKSDRAEGSACVLAALRCALGHPEVSVKCIKDDKEEFFSPGDGRGDSCVYSLLGRDMAANMLSCAGENGGISVTGFVSSPSAGRGNRAQQYFFCNGRYIKSAMLQAALEQAYKNTLLTGRYPACVLYLTLGLGSVDVNVHPAKTEVKFSDEKKVFDSVYYGVLSALQGEKIAADIPLSAGTKKTTEPDKNFYQTMPVEKFRSNGYAPAPKRPDPAPRTVLHQPEPIYSYHPPKAPVMPASRPATPAFYAPKAETMVSAPAVSSPVPTVSPEFSTVRESVPAPAGTPIIQKSVEPAAPEFRVVGEAMDTYIIVESGETLVLIDKHACHERMIFDRLKTQTREIMAQTLLIPVTITPTAEDGEIIEENTELLSELGFEIESYGEGAYVVRTVPADMDESDVAPAIEEICEKFRKNRGIDPTGARDEILHTVACKAAIKAGWKTDARELNVLAEAVISGKVKYCPHGRPVAVTLTRKELDKMFKRIV